jgi:UDP-N-acetylmuramoyl-L-alanyl-D-glutamate--2,6-diaminopimelate ligase
VQGGINMNLVELFGDYPILKTVGEMNKDILGIKHDSRKIKLNELFIAKKGFTKDGHKFINEAIKNGASTILLDEMTETIPGITYILVKDTYDAVSYISSRYFDEPSKKMTMVAITGTNGKTSTSYLIQSILNANCINTGIIGTLGVKIDDNLNKLENTTPEPISLHYNLYKMVKANIKACAMEVSSHALELKRAEYIDFDIGVFTNLTKDHLDYHKSMDNYFHSKLKLFYKTTKYNIINIDDVYGRKIIDEAGNRVHLLTYGIENNADIVAKDINYRMDKVSFSLNFNGYDVDIILNMPGKFSIYNALAAASVGVALGIDLWTIKAGLEAVEGIKGRFEIVPTNRDFSVIIDFAHTADGLEKVLKVIHQFAEGRIIVVFGAGGNRDRTKRPDMGMVVGLNADFAVITSDNPRNEEPSAIIEDILTGIKNTKIEYKVIIDRKEAIEYALKIARTNDIILLAGKGHETYTIFKDNIYPLDERQIVLDYLDII